ncbi:DNA cytosine methyltransferase [Sphaerospermopsis torques-reginae ITEP-024]|uniref:Cytosine-specific methyltransferase n=2 Tax=Sphaerospermopsis TaxID=752201 RepID=A0ABX8X0S6_9CYAN|nr:DNA cytosine methyltransferase [Sphaerospermopsis torques-reginae ITEP-024]
MDIGVRQAGFQILACIEIDPYCCQTLQSAIQREGLITTLIENDITQIQPSHLMRNLGLKSGELDLLFGGSPCQSFSQAGKHESLDDERGLLLFEFVRFAEVFQPKVIFIEQVKGFLNAKGEFGKIGGVFASLESEFNKLGYRLNTKIINSAMYGVAQLRERVFIVATKNIIPFYFPLPTHEKLDSQFSLFSLHKYLTVREVIAGLAIPTKDKNNPPEDSHLDITPAGDIRRIHGVSEGSFLAKELHLPQSQRGNLTKKDTTKFRRLSFSEPALTLRCGEIFFHPIEDRYLTPREYMRIHGYPDSYLLKGPIRGRSGRVKYLDQHRQIANSVTPPVAHAIADNIAQYIMSNKLEFLDLIYA